MSRGSGCPCCNSKKLSEKNGLKLTDIQALYNNKYREIIDVKTTNIGTKNKKFVKYKCLVDNCNYEGWTSLNSMQGGSGCAKCSHRVTLENDEIIAQFKQKHGDKYLYDKVNYVNMKQKVVIGCKKHGYFEQAPDRHRNGAGCPKCMGYNKTNDEKMEDVLKNIRPDVLLLDKEYKDIRPRCRCLKCNNEWNTTWESLKSGTGCPICGGSTLHDGNRISKVRPDLIKYFINPDEADNYAVYSEKKVILRCPCCKRIKETPMMIGKLTKRGFSCPYCSDKIPMGEKFGINFFKQLGIDIKTQKIFSWAKNKRYDFYFTLNDDDFIVEINGIQHYESSNRGRSLIEEQNNDKLKYELAIKNGIKPKNYIVIDCRKSELQWLKDNYYQSFCSIFDLSHVDWVDIWKNTQTSLLVKVCEEWKNKEYKDTVRTIATKFNIGLSTIRKYLKRGTELGLCFYDANFEKAKHYGHV